MDFGMVDYSNVLVQTGPSSLHDDLLQDIRETGMIGMASELGIIQNGELPEVKLHEQWASRPEGLHLDMPSSSPFLGSPAGRLAGIIRGDEATAHGHKLLADADNAAAAAAAAAQRAKQHAEESQARAVTENEEDPASMTTPQKGRRKSRNARSSGAEVGSGRAGGKGLRHFSMKVCEKVESKGRTTYNEVADELVTEFSAASLAGSGRTKQPETGMLSDWPNINRAATTGSPGGTDAQYDEKNIRRRVYDALNVLMAMDIIEKERKEKLITWRGLPSGPSTSLERLRAQKLQLTFQLEKQQKYIEELLEHQRGLRNLILRNQADVSQVSTQTGKPALQLPFILIQVSADTTVEIQFSEDYRHATLDFNSSPFKIHGDDDVLRQLNLHTSTPPALPTLTPAPSNPPRPATHSADHPLANGLGHAAPISSPLDLGLSPLHPSSFPTPSGGGSHLNGLTGGLPDQGSGNFASQHASRRPASGQRSGQGSFMGPPPDQEPGASSPVYGKPLMAAGKLSRLSSANFLPKPSATSAAALRSLDLPVASLRMPIDFSGSGQAGGMSPLHGASSGFEPMDTSPIPFHHSQQPRLAQGSLSPPPAGVPLAHQSWAALARQHEARQQQAMSQQLPQHSLLADTKPLNLTSSPTLQPCSPFPALETGFDSDFHSSFPQSPTLSAQLASPPRRLSSLNRYGRPCDLAMTNSPAIGLASPVRRI